MDSQIPDTTKMNGNEFYTRIRLPWDDDYRKIKTVYAFGTGEKSASRRAVPTLHPRSCEWTDTLLTELERDDANIDATYLTELTGDATYGWLQIAMWLLAHDPQHVLRFLLATHQSPWPAPPWAVSACLSNVAAGITNSIDASQSRQMQEMAEAFCKLAERHDGRRLTFHGPFITALLPHCSVDQVRHVHEAIWQHKVRIRYWTYLHLVDVCAKSGLYHEALAALIEAKQHPVTNLVGGVNSWPFRSACSTLLRHTITQPDGLRETLRIVSTIVDMGMQLDRPLCDIIMLNAIEAGDLKTAFDVYHSLMQRGLQPAESTFTVLLKGCKSNIDDVQMLDEIIRDAISNINVRESKVVADNILHCLAMHHSKHHPNTAFKTLFEAYAQFFDIEPLKRLGLQLPEIAPTPSTETAPMATSRHALFFVISAAINHMLLQSSRNPKIILPLYERWRELVEAGDPDLADLASTPDMSTHFLSAFVRSRNTLRLAARVVKDMQTPLPESAGLTQARPSEVTWNVFLHGFMRYGEHDLAEQVATHMRKTGIKETVVTWNTLLHGYAKANDVVKGLDVLRRAEEEGVQWNKWTDSALDKYKGEEGKKIWRAWLEWADRVGVRQLDFTDDVKDELVQRVGKEEVEINTGKDKSEGFAATPAELSHSDQGSKYSPM